MTIANPKQLQVSIGPPPVRDVANDVEQNPGRRQWFMRRRPVGFWSSRLAIVLIVAAVVSGLSTYGAMTTAQPLGRDPRAVARLLNLDLLILGLLALVIARRMIRLWRGRRAGVAGSRLHLRMVMIFGSLATAPAILMTIFAVFFLHVGVQNWFSERVRTAIVESQAVAEAYLQEHIEVIRADTLAMAHDLDRQAPLFLSDPAAFHNILQTQSMLRNLPEVAVFDSSGRILAHVGMNVTLEYSTIQPSAMQRADQGNVVVLTTPKSDRVQALVRLDNFPGGYLFVGRTVDPTVLSHVTDTRAAAAQYEQLEAQHGRLQVRITLIFAVVALLLLFVAIWLSLIFSRQLVRPIGNLINATDRVRAGDLTARVPAAGRQDEFDVLAFAFNRMTGQLQTQRHELMTANTQLDERRRFTETVLAGVSSGVVGIDEAGSITLANLSAASLFGYREDELVGRAIADVLPAIVPILTKARQRPGKIMQAEIPFIGRAEEARKTLLVRIASDLPEAAHPGAVLTFDDITELQSAQRKAAWADVARRIAHEIKNPLTPIQLSAERLKRKYLHQIAEAPEIFEQCTETIIQHVGDIGRMVDEFSSFARMPEPVMKRENLVRQLQDLLALQQQAHPDIAFNFAGPTDLSAMFDLQQIRQAFTNIIQNAIDSIRLRQEQTPGAGAVDILLNLRPAGDVAIAVTDNGIGLPRDTDLSRLTEPYVTYKEKGTGLGLAIVKKIMEDHGGRLILGAPEWLRADAQWQDRGGAAALLILPLNGPEQAAIPVLESARVIH